MGRSVNKCLCSKSGARLTSQAGDKSILSEVSTREIHLDLAKDKRLKPESPSSRGQVLYPYTGL